MIFFSCSHQQRKQCAGRQSAYPDFFSGWGDMWQAAHSSFAMFNSHHPLFEPRIDKYFPKSDIGGNGKQAQTGRQDNRLAKYTEEHLPRYLASSFSLSTAIIAVQITAKGESLDAG